MSEPIGILCVDDERNVLRALERIFLDDDYDILTASSGEEGLALLETSPQVQVVISDYRMPGMNGVDFLREVFLRRPDTVRIVLSGYADTAAVVAAINQGKIYKFLPKPWNDEELRMTVAKALDSFAIQRKNVQLAEELGQRNEELSRLNQTLEQQVEARTAQLQDQNRALRHAKNVLEHLPVGVVGLSVEGVVIQINREALLLLGKKPQDVLGKSAQEALPEGFGDLVREVATARCAVRQLTTAGIEVLVKGVAIEEDGEAGMVLVVKGRHFPGTQQQR